MFAHPKGIEKNADLVVTTVTGSIVNAQNHALSLTSLFRRVYVHNMDCKSAKTTSIVSVRLVLSAPPRFVGLVATGAKVWTLDDAIV